jgi:hypothetical protein
MTELGHLLLADAVFRALQWQRELRPAFCMGAIALDAHRATVSITYRDVHFRSARRAGYRLVDFLRRYLRPALQSDDPNARAFFAGYLTHLCADDVWRQKIRGELQPLWQRITGAAHLEKMALRSEFYDECDWVDIQLYQRNANLIEDLRWALEQASPEYAIPPLHPSDLHNWRQDVIASKLPPSNFSVTEPRLLSVDFMLDAIAISEEEAVGMINWELKQPLAEEV